MLLPIRQFPPLIADPPLAAPLGDAEGSASSGASNSSPDTNDYGTDTKRHNKAPPALLLSAMDQLKPRSTGVTTPATSKGTLPNVERIVTHPFGRYSPPNAPSSANTLDITSDRPTRSLRPTAPPAAATRSWSFVPAPPARGVPGVGRWGASISPEGFVGPVLEIPKPASDNAALELGSSPEMGLGVGPPGPARSAAAPGVSSDDPYGFEESFLIGGVGVEDSNSNSSGGSGGRNGNARMPAAGASSAREFGTASDGGDIRTGGLRSRFFGQPSRGASGESSGAGGGSTGSGGADEASEATRGGVGAAAAGPRASQVSTRASSTKAAPASRIGTTPPSTFGRAPGASTDKGEVNGSCLGMFRRPSRGSASVGGTGGDSRATSGGRSAEWTGGGAFHGEDRLGEEGGGGGGGEDSGEGAWSFESSKWGNYGGNCGDVDGEGDGDGDGDGDSGDSGDGDSGDGGGDDDRENQLEGERAQGLPRCSVLGCKDNRGESGQSLYSAAEQHALFVDADGGSRLDGVAGDDREDDGDGDADDDDGDEGGFRLLDAETDAQESRAKTTQRQLWIRRKDAAMTKFRRDCEVEVARIKSAVEDHVREMEDMLDEELILALDGSIAERVAENHREKIRARKIENLMSAFFCDPRVPKAQRVA
eukprot:g7860.t1